jgi:hypothetical protein
VHQDRWGFPVNQLLYYDRNIYRCCVGNSRYSIFLTGLEKGYAVPFDSDFVTWAKQKTLDCELCSICLCNNKVFDRMRIAEMSDLSMIKDIEHIRERMDEGISKTLSEVKKNQEKMMELLNADIVPKVQDNSWWVGKVKWVLVIVVISGMARIIWEKVGDMIRL